MRAASVGLLVISACGGAADPKDESLAERSAEPAKADRREVSAPVKRREPPLPRFEGTTLEGKAAGTDLFRRRRGLLFVFATDDPQIDAAAKLVAGIEARAAKSNIALLGVSRDADTGAARSFVAKYGFGFPILADRDFRISRTLGFPLGTAGVFVVDAEGYVLLGVPIRASGPGDDLDGYVSLLDETLRLPDDDSVTGPKLGLSPPAPEFRVVASDGQEITLADTRDSVTVLIFFLYSCPHCHEAMRFLDRFRKQLGREDFRIVAVSVLDQKVETEDGPKLAADVMAEKFDLGYPVYHDPGGAAKRTYTRGTGVPEIFVLDRDQKIVSYHQGMDPRIEALLRMEIQVALGEKSPLLLTKNGYSGEAACRICHTAQHETWSLTNHAYAFETLVEHGADRKPECLRCHTVGFGEPGGYDSAAPAAYLEGVQCENCHGRGGPHQSPDFAKAGYEKTCLGCHTPEHSLRFSFGERLPLISHSANLQFARLSIDERRKLLERRDKRQRTLFEPAAYVGSERCASCHAAESERWASSAHAHAFRTLESRNEAKNTACQTCHTTGFGQQGGFPAGGVALEQVGCESCHGPGGRHVDAGARREGTILALTDKCDSCVILQICGSCHDEKNDPNFEFELEDKLDLIRHGFRDREPPSSSSAE